MLKGCRVASSLDNPNFEQHSLRIVCERDMILSLFSHCIKLVSFILEKGTSFPKLSGMCFGLKLLHLDHTISLRHIVLEHIAASEYDMTIAKLNMGDVKQPKFRTNHPLGDF
ncbi:hypothetical protein CEXT_280371 [Caerostris extrusa]|uniref:Uncharacterized protein n=1 Tax=Caerostris extrusa TaxID=172846 RepID=A0AAV4TJ36_CAEEX|nr:hypothetical protein CEXT_280371 [Caerostris extrusa]